MDPGGIVVAIGLWFGLPWCFSRLWRLRAARHCRRRGLLVLTFDDGPGPDLTPRVLELLRRRGATAVFFVLGKRLEDPAARDLVQRIASAGHTIGCHGYEHCNYWRVGPLEALADVRRGLAAVRPFVPAAQKVLPFRPPYGKLDPVTLLYLLIRRIPIVWWTLDGCDTRGRSTSSPDAAAAEATRMGGGIVLSHDFDRRQRESNRFTLEALEACLEVAGQLPGGRVRPQEAGLF